MKFEMKDRIIYGADYNPDQWLDYPEIITDDFRMMKLANTNTFTLNIFGWSALEPSEGVYTFDWLDDIMDRMAEADQKVILSTPSGAKPAWLSEKYPEIRRVNERREKELHGLRHNHCFTSPVYRKKVSQLNRLLAERYQEHPALYMWHISNEFSGECHCDLCQDAFRDWLKEKYGTLDNLNKQWWTSFWSHKFSSWEQIESPSSIGESQLHALTIDWSRFVTHQTIDFYQNEVEPLKELTPEIPSTTNFMGGFPLMAPFEGLDYGKFAEVVDIVSWDAYPEWHNPNSSDFDVAYRTSFVSDLYRTLNDNNPYILMECTPSNVNWQNVAKLKKPGMNELQGVHSVAHGANGVLYFQWRKSKGSAEKFHGAVVSHDNRDDTRVFKEVSELGASLDKLKELSDTRKPAKVAVIYDWENLWAFNDSQGYGEKTKKYVETVQEHYKYFWDKGITVDVCTYNQDLSDYEIVIGPMLYLLPNEMVEKIETFVENGGIFVTTYISNIVNETDLVKGSDPIFDTLTGVRIEEIDSIYPEENVHFTYKNKEYAGKEFYESVYLTNGTSLGEFKDQMFKGSPAIIRNDYSKGRVYYMAVRADENFLNDFYDDLLVEKGIQSDIEILSEDKVVIQTRENNQFRYYFIMNFEDKKKSIELTDFEEYYSVLEGKAIQAKDIQLNAYDYIVLRKEL